MVLQTWSLTRLKWVEIFAPYNCLEISKAKLLTTLPDENQIKSLVSRIRTLKDTRCLATTP